jgi:hypothetical protein
MRPGWSVKPGLLTTIQDLGRPGYAHHLVRAGTVFAFLAEHRREVFPDSLFADLFPSGTGRPSLPADVVGSVMVLQRLHDLSDGETAEACAAIYGGRSRVDCR